MSAALDLTGRRFGFLLVLERRGSTARHLPRWLCRCICGATPVITGQLLRRGTTRSCGCRKAALRQTSIADARLRATRAATTARRPRWLTRAQAVTRVWAGGASSSEASARQTLAEWRAAGEVRAKPAGSRYWAFGAHREELLFNRADLERKLAALGRGSVVVWSP